MATASPISGSSPAIPPRSRPPRSASPLPQGGFAQGLICTHFVAGGADHHAMLAQYDTFALKKDHWYRLSFRAKGDLASTAAYAAIQQTAPTWETAGLNSPFRVHGEWRDINFTFRARSTTSGRTCDCRSGSKRRASCG